MRRAAFLALPYLAVLVLLGCVELAVRFTRPRVSSLDFLVTSPEQQAQFVDSRHVRIFEGDPLLFWRLMPNLREAIWDLTPVTTNDRGLRYDRSLGPKAHGAFRILCVGDSVTFGFRVPHVFLRRPQEVHPDWLPYPARMEKLLRAANPRRSIEVIPLAVPGYTSHQGLAWLGRDIGELRPDVVTVLFGWNDIGLRPRSDREAMKTDWLDVTARRVVSSSQALIHAWRSLHSRRREGSSRGGVMRVCREEFVANHLAMADLARRHGAKIVVIGPVYRDRAQYPSEADRIADHREALRTAMAQAGIPYLEIPELTESAYPANLPLFSEHIHPDHKGHRLLAHALLGFLAEKGFLPGLAVPVAEQAAP